MGINQGNNLIENIEEADRMRTWFVLRSATRRERTAVQHLQEAGVSVYLPQMTRWHGGGRRRRIVQDPLFPGYLFGGLAAHHVLYEVERLEAVHKAVRFSPDQGARPVPFGMIERLVRSERLHLFDKTVTSRAVPRDFKAGELVRINDGAFAGFNGTIVSFPAAARIQLLVSIFGRAVPTEMDVRDVEAIA